jgi:hypothetical protein
VSLVVEAEEGSGTVSNNFALVEDGLVAGEDEETTGRVSKPAEKGSVWAAAVVVVAEEKGSLQSKPLLKPSSAWSKKDEEVTGAAPAPPDEKGSKLADRRFCIGAISGDFLVMEPARRGLCAPLASSFLTFAAMSCALALDSYSVGKSSKDTPSTEKL